MPVPDAELKIYDASGRDRIALAAWLEMGRELWAFRELIHRLVHRSIAGQFRQSFLGYVWIALPPLATAVVFSLLREAQVIAVEMPEGSMPYPLFALVGVTLWGLFTQLTLMGTHSIVNAGALVSKIYFPREVLLLSSMGTGVINFCIRMLVVALAFLVAGYAPPLAVLGLPLVLLPLAALALGLSLLFAPLHTMTQDAGRILEFGFQFGMFLAPTVYPTPALDLDGSRWQIALFWVHQMNPVSHFLYAACDLIQSGTIHNDTGLAVASVFSFLVLALGWRFFHICEPLLAERL